KNRRGSFPIRATRDVSSPAHHGRPPGEAGAETAEHYELSRMQSAVRDRFVQRQRHGTGRRVAVAVEVVVYLAARNMQHINGGVDDADVGLMRDVQIDILRPKIAGV